MSIVANGPFSQWVFLMTKQKCGTKDLCIHYLDDLPNPTSISQEVDIWESKWLHCPEEKLPGTVKDTLRETNPVSFPNIATILKILGVIPFTSCTCERSASYLRILKTYFRITLSQKDLIVWQLCTHKNILKLMLNLYLIDLQYAVKGG